MSDQPLNGSVSLGKRLAGEFIVIVLGVLVALSVDAGLEVRAERARERAYYQSLARDLADDTAEYAIAIRMSARSIEAGHQVRSVILGDPYAGTRPLSQSVAYASWVNYPDWSSGTLDELYSVGTIRLIRKQEIKDAIHAYRSGVNEWRPRMQGAEYSAFLDYRRAAAGLIPLEALMAYEMTSLDDERVVGVEVDEALLSERLRGNQALLGDLETMIFQWVSLTVLYEEQRALALHLLNVLEAAAVADRPAP